MDTQIEAACAIPVGSLVAFLCPGGLRAGLLRAKQSRTKEKNHTTLARSYNYSSSTGSSVPSADTSAPELAVPYLGPCFGFGLLTFVRGSDPGLSPIQTPSLPPVGIVRGSYGIRRIARPAGLLHTTFFGSIPPRNAAAGTVCSKRCRCLVVWSVDFRPAIDIGSTRTRHW